MILSTFAICTALILLSLMGIFCTIGSVILYFDDLYEDERYEQEEDYTSRAYFITDKGSTLSNRDGEKE